MIRKRLIAMATLLLASVGLIFAGASPAQAADSWEVDYAVDVSWSDTPKECNANTYVSGCVQAYGDMLWVKDNEKDGHRVTLEWSDPAGDRAGQCINTLGADRAWTACNKNFSEGHIIYWSLKYTDSAGVGRTLGSFMTYI